MLASRPGWFGLTWAISRHRAFAARRKVFLTVHGINGDHATGQAEFADEALDGRDLVGFVIDLDMAEDERAVRLEGAHQVTRLLVGEVVVAAAQGLAVESNHAHALDTSTFP